MPDQRSYTEITLQLYNSINGIIKRKSGTQTLSETETINVTLKCGTEA